MIAEARRGEATPARVARDLGISPSCLQRWLGIADREDGIVAAGPPGDGPGEAEGRGLHRCNELLEQEEVLHRATACSARDADDNAGRAPRGSRRRAGRRRGDHRARPRPGGRAR